MRIGIISDIHGQPEALERALEELRSMDVDRIICAGDLVDKGPDAEGAIDLIRRWLIPCVQGNHDERAVKDAAFEEIRGYGDEEQVLSEEALAYLDALPKTREWVWEGQRVMLAHGTPVSNTHYLWPDRGTPKSFKRWARFCDVDILILGHTHKPMRLEWRDLLILNPGSVSGIRTRDSRTFGVLTLPSREFDVFEIPDEVGA